MPEFPDDTALDHIAFRAYGTELLVFANSAELLARVKPLLPPGAQPCKATPEQPRLGIILEDDGTYSVYGTMHRISEGQGLELSLVVLDGQIRGWVALNAPEMTFVHAGTVAHEGRAIVMPGHSFSGKTMLTAALVRAGATYYSDEFAVFGDDGLIHPYAKPLSLRPDPPIRQSDHGVEELGGVAGQEPIPLGLLVVTYFQPEARWQPKQLSAGEAALALLSSTVTARSRPDEAMRALARALDGAVALEGERGEADEVAGQLLEAAAVGTTSC
jgi:hypothetical protein